jgi:hypothetical protein
MRLELKWLIAIATLALMGCPAVDATHGPMSADQCGNGLDDDGNGQVDDGCPCSAGSTQRCFAGDPAMAGIGACAFGTQSCIADGEFGTWGPCTGSGEPGAEVCADGVDNNCDGSVDENCPECTASQTRSCYAGPMGTQDVGACRAGQQACSASGWGSCTGQVLPATESCDDMVDNDCDGQVDCNDSDCAHASNCYVCSPMGAETDRACSDHVDNDCDGQIDCIDADCATAAVCCTPVHLTASATGGDVMYVLDGSDSMGDRTLDGTSTKWAALNHAMNAALPAFNTTMRMGAYIFPSGLCAVSESPVVPLQYNASTAVHNALAAHNLTYSTPIVVAMNRTRTYYANHPSARPRFVVLATDGLPTCNETASNVTSLISSLHSAGIDTFVMGITGAASSDAVLNSWAVAGGRSRSGTRRYYGVGTVTEFENALQTIVSHTVRCTFTLSRPISNPASAVVQAAGTSVPQNATDGWSLVDSDHLRFNGASCSNLVDGTAITVAGGCP